MEEAFLLGWTDVLLILLVLISLWKLSSIFSKKEKKVAVTKPKENKPDPNTTFWSREEVAKHNSVTDCWLIVDNKVYDVTPYVEDHVGGKKSISKNAGQDNTIGVKGPQHPDRVITMLDEYFIGHLAE